MLHKGVAHNTCFLSGFKYLFQVKMYLYSKAAQETVANQINLSDCFIIFLMDYFVSFIHLGFFFKYIYIYNLDIDCRHLNYVPRPVFPEKVVPL